MMDITVSSKANLKHFDVDKVKLYVMCAGSTDQEFYAKINEKGIPVFDAYGICNHTNKSDHYEELADLIEKIKTGEGQVVIQCDFGQSRSYALAAALTVQLGQLSFQRMEKYGEEEPRLERHNANEQSIDVELYLIHFKKMHKQGLIEAIIPSGIKVHLTEDVPFQCFRLRYLDIPDSVACAFYSQENAIGQAELYGLTLVENAQELLKNKVYIDFHVGNDGFCVRQRYDSKMLKGRFITIKEAIHWAQEQGYEVYAGEGALKEATD